MRISDWSSDVCSSDLVGRLDRSVEERTADIVGIVAIIGPAHALEHARLAIDVGRDGISLGDPQRDLARRQRREYERSQFGKPYPLLNEAGRDAETFRHILGTRAQIGSASCRERVCQYV